MSGIIRPTQATVADAVAQEDEHRDLLQAMTTAGMALDPRAVKAAMDAFHGALRVGTPGMTVDLDVALALIATVAANGLADLVIQIEKASPISNAGRDGRVQAVVSFTKTLLERAVQERALVRQADAVGAAHLAKLQGTIQ